MPAGRTEPEVKYVVPDASTFEKLLSLETLGEYRLVPADDPPESLVELLCMGRHRSGRDVTTRGLRVAVLSLDRVESDPGTAQATHQLEIELTPLGAASDLQTLGNLLHSFGLRPLRSLERTPERRKKRPGVLAGDPMSEAGRKILRLHCETMLAREAGTLAGEDPEELHDMRVATRRQRAALRIVGAHFPRKATRAVRDGLRALGGVLGAVRDLDVLLDAVCAHRSTLPAEEARALQGLVDSWTRRRSEARARMLGHLDGQGYSEFKEAYARFLDAPGRRAPRTADGLPQPTLVAHVVPAEIWAHYAAVCAFGTVLPWASVETLHALRIEGKGLRYLLEFFREALDPCVEEAIDAIVAMQDHLGGLQDAVVAVGLVREFLVGPEATAGPDAARAAGRYLESRQARIEELRRSIDRPWAGVSGAAFKACLARAVAAL
jgi:CHAD domain-containing protein